MMPPPATDAQRELVFDVIRRFLELTGVDAAGAVGDWTGRTSRSVSATTLSVEPQVRDLQDMAAYDPTLVTAWMLLDRYVREWLRRQDVSAYALVYEPETVRANLDAARKLAETMTDPGLADAVDAFRADVREAIHRFLGEAPPSDDLAAWVDDPAALAILRRDALRAVDAGEGNPARRYYPEPGLELHTFAYGAPGATEVHPKLADHVYEFWNLPSFLRALRAPTFPDRGIAVALIRDPEALHSFFVIGIRDGDRVHVLTDRSRDHQTHPLRAAMSRRPDREFDRRATRWWFPYELVDVEVSEDQKRLYAVARTALVPVEARGVPLRRIADLHPASLVWILLVVDLLRDRFFRGDRRALTTSYTGEMVRRPHALADAGSALVRTGDYRPLVLPPVTARGLTPKAMGVPADVPRPYQWMVDRWGPRVPDDVLDVVGPAECTAVLADLPYALAPAPSTTRIEAFRPVPEKPLALQGLDPSTFGSPEKLAQDRAWLGALNRCRAIQRLADAAYARDEAGALAWYADRIQRAAPALQAALAAGTLWIPSGARGTPAQAEPGALCPVAWVDDLMVGVGSRWYGSTTRWARSDGSTRRGFGGRAVEAWVTPESYDVDGVFGYVSPDCPEGIALLCGVSLNELPWPLRYHLPKSLQPYVGNSILDRIHPEAWALRNPCENLALGVGIVLTRTRANALRKELGLPRRDWDALVAPEKEDASVG